MFRLAQSILSILQVQLFDLRSRPRGPSQELQAGLDAWGIIKASDINDLPHFLPSMMLHQLGKHHFKGDPVKGIFMLLFAHLHSIYIGRAKAPENDRHGTIRQRKIFRVRLTRRQFLTARLMHCST